MLCFMMIVFMFFYFQLSDKVNEHNQDLSLGVGSSSVSAHGKDFANTQCDFNDIASLDNIYLAFTRSLLSFVNDNLLNVMMILIT